jgi:hypothetical protein
MLCACRRSAWLLRLSWHRCRRLWRSGVGERPGCQWGARRRLRRLGLGCRNCGGLRSGVHAGGRRWHALGRRCSGGGVPILRESGERVEDVRAAPAANITLRHAQIRRGNDKSQGALWADRKHYSWSAAVVTPSGKADPTLALSERVYIKPCVISACHVGYLALHEPRQDQVPAGAYEGRKARRQLA